MALEDHHIDLNRTFYRLSDYVHSLDEIDDDLDMTSAFRVGTAQKWDDLLKEYRTVILSEAGAGKTTELRHISEQLQSQGKPAFFLRIENIFDDIEDSFEKDDDFSKFKDWLASDKQGWIFLDSVDEAKLASPKDFERAINKISKTLKPALHRAHIYLTSRVHAWRPKSDLDLCNKRLASSNVSFKAISEEPNSRPTDKPTKTEQRIETGHAKDTSDFVIYSLGDLSKDQIVVFIESKSIDKSDEFLDAIDRADAHSYTTRPLDLEDLVNYWIKYGTIGSPLELKKHNIKSRLEEWDQKREDANPISPLKLSTGAKTLASALTLIRNFNIRVDDGRENQRGVSSKDILYDWDGAERDILLSRPIFDEAIYGTVRFHDRSVREFLTSQWICEQLESQTSRRPVESLFFKRQYDTDVIIPSMRDVLSWLILFDPKILEKARSIDPEIVFNCGDPGKLPIETRIKALQDLCNDISLGYHANTATQREAARRFAQSDISQELKYLVTKYKNNNDISWFIMLMVWQGQLKDLLPETVDYLLDNNAYIYTRIAAAKALRTLSPPEQYLGLIESLSLESDTDLPHSLASEIIQGLPTSDSGVKFVIDIITKTPERKRYSTDGLDDVLAEFIEKLDIEALPQFITGIDRLLSQEPFVERKFCEVSKRYGWTIKAATKAVERLVENRNQLSFDQSCLNVLIMLPAAQRHNDHYSGSIDTNLYDFVPNWQELNHELFWHNIRSVRASCKQKNKDVPSRFWQYALFESLWEFGFGDLEIMVSNIENQNSLEDKHISLQVALDIYSKSGRPAKWRRKIRSLASQHGHLSKEYDSFMHPKKQSNETKNFKRQEARWERDRKKREEAQEKRAVEWKNWLSSHIDSIRDTSLSKQGLISNEQNYLLEKTRDKCDGSSSWSEGNWRDLIEEFGLDVATSFRDAAINYWRLYSPPLQSEKDEGNSTTYATILGLTGILIESRENEEWLSSLSDEEAKLACRYAFQELNAFPEWFHRLYQKFQDIVVEHVLIELAWELNSEKKEHSSHYILHDIVWHAEWIWPDISAFIFNRLETNEPTNTQNILYCLKIALSSKEKSQNKLCNIARAKCKAGRTQPHIEHWYAVLVSLDPDNAIPSLSQFMDNYSDPAEATEFFISFLLSLVGDRRSHPSTIASIPESPKHLTDLYMLALKHVRVEDDIHRSGVFSPTNRDDAQEAREKLFSMLSNTPGKDAYTSILNIANMYPDKSRRAWIQQMARIRATADSEHSPLSTEQFLQFSKELESTPTNHRALYELSVQRMGDLKDELEGGDDSLAPLLINAKDEPMVRNYVGNWCRSKQAAKYSVQQENELADGKKPDLRIQGNGFDGPVPIELKLAEKWSGPKLIERLENQLCGDYLRDTVSSCGIFLLINRAHGKHWEDTNSNKMTFNELISFLEKHWKTISTDFNNVDDITIIGIDLTKRLD